MLAVVAAVTRLLRLVLVVRVVVGTVRKMVLALLAQQIQVVVEEVLEVFLAGRAELEEAVLLLFAIPQ